MLGRGLLARAALAASSPPARRALPPAARALLPARPMPSHGPLASVGATRGLGANKPSLEGIDGPEHLKGKVGPFAPAEVDDMEDWAWENVRTLYGVKSVPVTLDHFLRTKLGLQYHNDWRSRASQRLVNRLREAELQARRPPASTHFVVSHPHPEPGKDQGAVFAVMLLKGIQYKVCTGDVVAVAKLDAEVGKRITVDEVLMLGERSRTLIGRPFVPGVQIACAVEQQTKEAKVLAYHKNSKKKSKNLHGSRRDVTVLRVMDITLPTTDAAETAKSAASAPLPSSGFSAEQPSAKAGGGGE